MNTSAEDIHQAFAAETDRLVAARLPIGAIALAVVFGIAWIFEHQTYPQRDRFYAPIYLAQLLTLAIGLLEVRTPRWHGHARVVAVCTTLSLVWWVGLYHVLAQGQGEVLTMAFLYMLIGTMVVMPWGWQGQLPIVTAMLMAYLMAVLTTVHLATPLSMNVLGLGTISGLSVAASGFMAQQRRAFMQQAAELRAANTALEKANQAKNQFLAGVSHELRTPLNIIVGYTDLLLEEDFGTLPEDVVDAVERIARNGRTLVFLINDLLDLARIEAGHLAVRLADVPLEPLFGEMKRFVEPRLGGKQVSFVPESPGALAVVADRDRLEQILVNLLSNAAKFTDAGEIRLCARPATDASIFIEVHDTGVGIASSEISTLFEPFSQGEFGKKLGGVGIGLSLSSRLAQAMGGDLTARSELGRGSTFVLRLPAAAA